MLSAGPADSKSAHRADFEKMSKCLEATLAKAGYNEKQLTFFGTPLVPKQHQSATHEPGATMKAWCPQRGCHQPAVYKLVTLSDSAERLASSSTTRSAADRAHGRALPGVAHEGEGEGEGEGSIGAKHKQPHKQDWARTHGSTARCTEAVAAPRSREQRANSCYFASSSYAGLQCTTLAHLTDFALGQCAEFAALERHAPARHVNEHGLELRAALPRDDLDGDDSATHHARRRCVGARTNQAGLDEDPVKTRKRQEKNTHWGGPLGSDGDLAWPRCARAVRFGDKGTRGRSWKTLHVQDLRALGNELPLWRSQRGDMKKE
ncbi:hypothetical protein DFH07DRAFT_782400 [Mycena maculata]|uniref:Uncharacterized protein n=1 Tax=Mycena maculata TaxID=230809 RepID=A0AAD7MQM5_9AGAR|nr:hypothetical protein DFH07DRAFT_782400 [Mycena maculata]